MNTNNNTYDYAYDAPSLQQEAEAQNIEIRNSSTDQIQYAGDNGNGVDFKNSQGANDLENNTRLESSTDNNDNENATTTEEDTTTTEEYNVSQEDVDKHNKTISSIKEDLKSKGIDFNSAIKEYEDTGSLSQATIEALNKAGYPTEAIDAFIEGRRAMEERFTNAIFESVGGEKEYKNIVNWASQNLDKKSIDAFNQTIDGNNINAITLMLEGIRAKMIAKIGTANKSIYGGATAPKSSPKGYSTKTEIIKAMSDPRYGRDAEYTRLVEQQMWATNI